MIRRSSCHCLLRPSAYEELSQDAYDFNIHSVGIWSLSLNNFNQGRPGSSAHGATGIESMKSDISTLLNFYKFLVLSFKSDNY